MEDTASVITSLVIVITENSVGVETEVIATAATVLVSQGGKEQTVVYLQQLITIPHFMYNKKVMFLYLNVSVIEP